MDRITALEFACVGFALLGLGLALGGETAAFGPWHRAADAALFGGARPAELAPLVATTLGILGGSITGKWVAAWWLVRHGVRAGHRPAHDALVVGLVTWFVVDSGVSVAAGAAFNVWMVNVVPLVVVGGLLVATRRETRRPTGPPPVGSIGTRVLRAVCAGTEAIGALTAVSITGLAFGPYRAAIADAWFGGELPVAALTWIRFVYGPIGATIAGQFAMLWVALRAWPDAAWVRRAVVVSTLAWFAIDTPLSLWHGAAFNVWMVNLPSLALVLGAAAWASRDQGG